MFIYDKSARK